MCPSAVLTALSLTDVWIEIQSGVFGPSSTMTQRIFWKSGGQYISGTGWDLSTEVGPKITTPSSK
jgi:hypothetical protein